MYHINKSKFYFFSDRHSGASEDEKKEHERKFKEVGEAYGVLSDTKKRSRYDNGHDVDDLENDCNKKLGWLVLGTAVKDIITFF